MKKRLMTTILASIMVLSMSICAFAGQWIGDDATGWIWINDDGSIPVNQWVWIDDNGDGIEECYFFDENGFCVTAATTPDGSEVNSDGAWIVNGEVQHQAATTFVDTSAVMPYKAIIDLYNSEDDDLYLWYYGDQIIEGDDYYEFPDCSFWTNRFYDTNYVESKKVGDIISIGDIDHKITGIRTYDGRKIYDLDYIDGNYDDWYLLEKRDKGYVAMGDNDWTERICVYEGPVRFRKNVSIEAGLRHVAVTPEEYFFEVSPSSNYNLRQHGYMEEFYNSGTYIIKLRGYVKTDDQGYITYYREIFEV